MNTSPAVPLLKIFVVENHSDTLRWLKLYLEELDHTVITAANFTEAVATLPGAACDVLISDIGLPDGNGWDLLDKVSLSRPIFAIAMSGFGMSADNARSRSAGYRYHLVKPFKTAELDRILAEAALELAQPQSGASSHEKSS